MRVLGLEPAADDSRFTGLGVGVMKNVISDSSSEIWKEILKTTNIDIAEFKKNNQAAKREAKKVESDKIVLSGFMSNIEIDFSPVSDKKLKSTAGASLASVIEVDFNKWATSMITKIDDLK